MKLKSKKMATLLIAIFMISTLAVAVNADLYDRPQEGGKGTVELVDTISHSVTHSAKLTLPAPIYNLDEARVKFDYNGDLNSLTGVSFYAHLETSYPQESGFYAPYVTATLDRDSDGNADAWLVQYHPVLSYTGKWLLGSFDDTTEVAVSQVQDGGPPSVWFVPEPVVLATLKGMDTPEGSIYPTWGECPILEVKVGVGTTGAGVPAENTLIAYVDDVTINDDLYDFEPGATAVPVSAGVTARSVSINVVESDINFGPILEGESGSTVVNIENKGTVNAYVTASLADESPSGFYTANLKMDGTHFVADWFLTSLAPNGPTQVDLTLSIPLGTSAGSKTAILVFWAEEAV